MSESFAKVFAVFIASVLAGALVVIRITTAPSVEDQGSRTSPQLSKQLSENSYTNQEHSTGMDEETAKDSNVLLKLLSRNATQRSYIKKEELETLVQKLEEENGVILGNIYQALDGKDEYSNYLANDFIAEATAETPGLTLCIRRRALSTLLSRFEEFDWVYWDEIIRPVEKDDVLVYTSNQQSKAKRYLLYLTEHNIELVAYLERATYLLHRAFSRFHSGELFQLDEELGRLTSRKIKLPPGLHRSQHSEVQTLKKDVVFLDALQRVMVITLEDYLSTKQISASEGLMLLSQIQKNYITPKLSSRIYDFVFELAVSGSPEDRLDFFIREQQHPMVLQLMTTDPQLKYVTGNLFLLGAIDFYMRKDLDVAKVLYIKASTLAPNLSGLKHMQGVLFPEAIKPDTANEKHDISSNLPTDIPDEQLNELAVQKAIETTLSIENQNPDPLPEETYRKFITSDQPEHSIAEELTVGSGNNQKNSVIQLLSDMPQEIYMVYSTGNWRRGENLVYVVITILVLGAIVFRKRHSL